MLHLVHARARPTRSYLGGVPRGLPEWVPSFVDEEGEDADEDAMSFVGQFDFAEAAAQESHEWLPAEGRLYLFYNLRWCPGGYAPEHRRGFAVRYVAGTPSAPIDEWEQAWPEWPDGDLLGLDDRRVPLAFTTEPADGAIGSWAGPDMDDVIQTARLARAGYDAGGDVDPDDPDVRAILGAPGDLRVLLTIDASTLDDWEGVADRLHVVVEAADTRRGEFASAWVAAGYDE